MASWDIKADDNRQANTKATFIIFCEDGVCEPAYFRQFQAMNPNIKVNVIENQRSGKLNLQATLEWCYNNGLLEVEKQTYKIRQGITEHLWCVYDRDLETDNLSAVKLADDIAFTAAIQQAEQIGLRVGWSNDAFELWILLHFEVFNASTRVHRGQIYQRLTDIFQNIQTKSTLLEKLTANPQFSYKQTMKQERNFVQEVLPRLKGNIQQAITNAESLEQSFSDTDPYHACNPSTRVHHLVLEMLNA